MKTGMTTVDLLKKVEQQHREARDFVADTRRMSLSTDAKSIELADTGTFELKPHAKGQLAEKMDIPRAFYDRLEAKHPDLLKVVVDELFEREPGQHMIRTLPGVARAVLSNGYRPLDNYALADAIMPVLMEAGATITSCNLSDTQLYIKALCPWLTRELEVPEGLKMGVGHTFFLRKVEGAVTFRNSEVGSGGVSVLPGIWEEQCTNLATFRNDGLVKIHLGKKTSAEEIVSEYLSDQTKRLDDAAFWSTVRDHAKAVMDGRVFGKICDAMVKARGHQITGNPTKVVEIFSKKNDLSKDEAGGLLRHLVNSGEMTQYGLQWAVTRLAGETESYDRASELERLGGKVIELPANDWEVLAQAA